MAARIAGSGGIRQERSSPGRNDWRPVVHLSVHRRDVDGPDPGGALSAASEVDPEGTSAMNGLPATKPEHLAADPNCSCCLTGSWEALGRITGQPSRRGFLAGLAGGAAAASAIAAAGAATPAAAAMPVPPFPTSLVAKVNAVIDADAARLTEIFQDLHRHPEIAFTETRTADIVATALRELGYAVTTGIGRTGVVGVLANGAGPTLWFRADMDANGGVRETTGLPYAAAGPQQLPDGTEVDAMHA